MRVDMYSHERLARCVNWLEGPHWIKDTGVLTYLHLRLLAIDIHENVQINEMVFQGWNAQQGSSPTLGSPNRDKKESSPSCSTRHEVEGHQAGSSFPHYPHLYSSKPSKPSAQKYPTLPSIQQWARESKQSDSKMNEESRRSSHNLTLQTSLGFVSMCMYKCFAIEQSQNN